MTPASASPTTDPARVEAFAGRVFGAGLAALEIATVYLGDRLGLYAVLRDAGEEGLTSSGLAGAAGIHERYAREWLEQQAVCAIVAVDDVRAGAGQRRYALPAEHAEVLCDEKSLAYLSPLARHAAACFRTAPQVQEAFRTGAGVPWSAYGQDGREAQAAFNRPIFDHLLAQEWLPAMADVDERLRRPGARVADVACGAGWSSIAMARGYPEATVDAYDSDPASVELAQANAERAGVGDRVQVHLLDVAGNPPDAGYDLVTVFEALHDMSRPVEALQTIRTMARPDGAVLVVDERTAEAFTAPGDENEQLFYAFSVLLCLPTGMDHEHPVGTGTAMRADTVRSYASEAGFAAVDVLPVEHDLFRLYRLAP